VPVETPAPVAAAKDDKAAPVVAAPIAATEDATPAFDPEADPLDAMPAVRLAMEQGGHVSASSQAPAKTAPTTTQDQPTAAQNFAAGLATMVDQQATKDSTDQGGDKAFSGLIEGGLKDLKEASSDTRVDDFANRLAALTQAATPKNRECLAAGDECAAGHASERLDRRDRQPRDVPLQRQPQVGGDPVAAG